MLLNWGIEAQFEEESHYLDLKMRVDEMRLLPFNESIGNI